MHVAQIRHALTGLPTCLPRTCGKGATANEIARLLLFNSIDKAGVELNE